MIDTMITKLCLDFSCHQALKPFKSKSIPPEGFLCFVCERIESATAFIDLLKKLMSACQYDKDPVIQKVIEENFYDECGIGKENGTSHEIWRKDYLEEVQRLHQGRSCCCKHTCHFVYKQAFHDVLNRGNKDEMLGVLLYLERIIPIEFVFIRSYQDNVFHNVFVHSSTDTNSQRALKRKLRRYLDDHIVHDAVDHYPKLLHAIKASDVDLRMQEQIMQSAQNIHHAKLLSYETHFCRTKTG